MRHSGLKRPRWIGEITKLFHKSKMRWLRWRLAKRDRPIQKSRTQEQIDATVNDSFPASDPPPWSGGISGSGQHR